MEQAQRQAQNGKTGGVILVAYFLVIDESEVNKSILIRTMEGESQDDAIYRYFCDYWGGRTECGVKAREYNLNDLSEALRIVKIDEVPEEDVPVLRKYMDVYDDR